VKASLFTDPDTKAEMTKQINVAVRRMKAFDQLPPEIRQAIEQSKRRVDVIDVLETLQMGWSEEQLLAALRQERADTALLNLREIGTVADRTRNRP
jgi:hypothetical protein